MLRHLVLLLSVFCSVGVHAGQWRYQDETDQMTGKKAEYATIQSDNSLSLGFPYSGRNHGTLTVRKHPKHGVDVLVSVDKGQILCHSYSGCYVAVRFDAGKPQRFSALEPGDHSSETVFIENSSRFIQAAKKAKRILLQVTMYREGEQVLEFTSPVELVWK
jgi:hypothetical protein